MDDFPVISDFNSGVDELDDISLFGDGLNDLSFVDDILEDLTPSHKVDDAPSVVDEVELSDMLENLDTGTHTTIPNLCSTNP